MSCWVYFMHPRRPGTNKPRNPFLTSQLITSPASVCVAVNEIIDRDIGSLTSNARPDQFDQYHQYDWEDKPGDAALPFRGPQ